MNTSRNTASTPTNPPANAPMNTPMNTQELIELAVLDATGLLDEQERDAFDAAFAKAAPAIQAQIRREQTRLSMSHDLLPDVEPPAGLRALVLEAVRKAMSMPGRERHRHARAMGLALVPSRQVSPLWRAASVGFAAAAVVFGVTFLHLKGEFGQLAKAVESDRLISDMQGAVGSPYVVSLLSDPQTLTRELLTMPGATRGQARLWTNPQWGEGDEALLAMSNLPAVRDDMLAICTFAGGVLGEPVYEFQAQAGFQMVKFSSPLIHTTRLALAAKDEHGVYQPLMTMPVTAGLAWAGAGERLVIES